MHHEVAARVCAAEKEHANCLAADIDGLLVCGHCDWWYDDNTRCTARDAGCSCGGRVPRELRTRRRVHDVRDVLREDGVAGGVIAVVGTHDIPLYGKRRDLPDVVQQRLGGRCAPLSVRDEHAVAPYHEETHGGEARLADFLIAVDMHGELHDAREVAELESALERIGSARLGVAGGRQGSREGEQRKSHCS